MSRYGWACREVVPHGLSELSPLGVNIAILAVFMRLSSVGTGYISVKQQFNESQISSTIASTRQKRTGELSDTARDSPEQICGQILELQLKHMQVQKQHYP